MNDEEHRLPEQERVIAQRITHADLRINVVQSSDLSPWQRREIVALCNAAYGEDLESLFHTFGKAGHLLGIEHGELVSHAMWVTRWLQPDGLPKLETAYVEMVATGPGHQGRGMATKLLERLPHEIGEFELAALCPADTSLYARLGWEQWQGDLFIRRGDTLQPTPDERIMVRRLPRTSAELETGADLSAEWRPGELW